MNESCFSQAQVHFFLHVVNLWKAFFMLSRLHSVASLLGEQEYWGSITIEYLFKFCDCQEFWDFWEFYAIQEWFSYLFKVYHWPGTHCTCKRNVCSIACYKITFTLYKFCLFNTCTYLVLIVVFTHWKFLTKLLLKLVLLVRFFYFTV